MHSAVPLGRLLVNAGLLTQQALDEVLAFQKTDGRRLGELLAEKGLVRPHQLAQFLSHQLACPWVSLQRVEVAREAVDTLPRDVALKHHMVPVHLRTSKGATALYVAMDDPTDDVALAEAAARTTMAVKPMVALTTEIRTLLDRLYGAPQKKSPSLVVKDGTSRPPKPPPPRSSLAPPPPLREDLSILDEIDFVEDDSTSRPSKSAKVFVIDPNEGPVRTVRATAGRHGADTVTASLADVARIASEMSPCPIVVEEEVYESGRSNLDKLAPDVGAQLVAASKQFERRQIEGFLEASIKRWQMASYEKGAIIEGRYELLRDLGGRFVGSRWEVRHVRTARRAMLKVGVRAAQDEPDAEAVRREQLALSRFQHPGAVELRDAGHTELGDPFVVVEMLEGRTLEGLVAARGALDPREACVIIRHVAEVLVTAHDAGVLHHEVRPENVVVFRDAWGGERTKLVHWESATVSEGSPEATVDLAGLGACAFLALVGRARIDGESVSSSMVPAAPDLETELARVVARAIGGAQAKRFASVKDFIEALDKATPRGQMSSILGSDPERRGTSHHPGPPEIRPPAKVEELRRHRRAPYRTPVRVEVTGVGAIDGRSEDVSETGLLIVTRGKIAQGATVTVRFALPIDGKVVSETGIVRWTRGPKSSESNEPLAIGVELTSPNEESTCQIARYVSFMAS